MRRRVLLLLFLGIAGWVVLGPRAGATVGVTVPGWNVSGSIDAYTWEGSVRTYVAAEARFTIAVTPGGRFHARWECDDYNRGAMGFAVPAGAGASQSWDVRRSLAEQAYTILAVSTTRCAFHVYQATGNTGRFTTSGSVVVLTPGQGQGPPTPTPTPAEWPTPPPGETPTPSPSPTPTGAPTLPPASEPPTPTPGAEIWYCPLPSGFIGPPGPTTSPMPGCVDENGNPWEAPPTPTPTPPSGYEWLCRSRTGQEGDTWDRHGNACADNSSPFAPIPEWFVDGGLRITVTFDTVGAGGGTNAMAVIPGPLTADLSFMPNVCGWGGSLTPGTYVCDVRNYVEDPAPDAGSFPAGHYSFTNNLALPEEVTVRVVNLWGADHTGEWWGGTIEFGYTPGQEPEATPTPTPSPTPTPTAGPTPTPPPGGYGVPPPSGAPPQYPPPGSGTGAPGEDPEGNGLVECVPTYPKPGQAPLTPVRNIVWPADPWDLSGWLSGLGQAAQNVPTVAGNAVQGAVNAGIDLAVPSDCIETMYTDFAEGVLARAPFSYIAELTGILESATDPGTMAGADIPELCVNLPLPGGGHSEVCEEVGAYTGGLVEYRWIGVVLVWIGAAVTIFWIILGTVGHSGAGEE